ncbi:thermonuclease family protein [Planctomycetota bacterium]
MKKRNKYLLLISGIIILALIPVSIYVNFFYEPRFPIYRLVYVVDADTFIIDMDGKEERVRLLYVNTPESYHPGRKKNTVEGLVVYALVKNMLQPGTKVVLEKEEGRDDRDRYRSLLRYMFVPGKITGGETDYINFNVWLVKNGYSPYYVEHGRSKKYDKEFREAAEFFKNNKVELKRK